MLLELQAPLIEVERVLTALRTVRVARTGQLEFAIHDAVCGALLAGRIPHQKEQVFGPRCRADVWVDGIVIEVKKQRPPRASLEAQLTRYAQQECVREIVVVLERSILLPSTIECTPIHVISLNALWGIAL